MRFLKGISSFGGLIFAALAGALMSLQGVFNTRVNEKIGIWEATALCQGVALVTTLVILMFAGNGDFKKIHEVNKWYLLGGVMGALITFTVIKGISMLGPTYAISTILVAQLITAALIDRLAWFGCEMVNFGWTKILGVAIMIVGIVVFKWKC
jgi:bacterial/archaeal transporter family-2 protein